MPDDIAHSKGCENEPSLEELWRRVEELQRQTSEHLERLGKGRGDADAGGAR